MMRISKTCLLTAILALLSCAAMPYAARALITEAELRSRIEQATRGFKDISMVGTVVNKNKRAITKIDSNYARLYDFKSANVSFKYPDKLRMDGKLGMVKFEYIINGGAKIVRASMVRFSKREDFSNDPAKLQDAFDIGLVTPSIWKNRRVEVIDDPEAAANGEVKVRLHWPKGDMMLLAWIDEKDLWLKRFEKRTGGGELQLKVVYTNPRKAGGVVWMPTTVELYAADGEKAGTTEYTDIKVNTGLSDSVFE